jgi:hypothetical protein
MRGDIAEPGEARGPARAPLRVLRALGGQAGSQFRLA